jgi:hypothetical protein
MNYGPLGLAGLLLVLVIITLLLRKVDSAQAQLLKLVLYVGAFCFVAALVAQLVTLEIQPPPAPPPDFSKQRDVLKNVRDGLAAAEPQLQEVVQMASTNGCPGGSNGIAIPHGPDMAARSSAVKATLSAAEANLNSVINSLPSNAH